MTRTSVEELVEAVRPRYVKANRSQKSQILDEFVAVTGFHRSGWTQEALESSRFRRTTWFSMQSWLAPCISASHCMRELLRNTCHHLARSSWRSGG